MVKTWILFDGLYFLFIAFNLNAYVNTEMEENWFKNFVLFPIRLCEHPLRDTSTSAKSRITTNTTSCIL